MMKFLLLIKYPFSVSHFNPGLPRVPTGLRWLSTLHCVSEVLKCGQEVPSKDYLVKEKKYPLYCVPFRSHPVTARCCISSRGNTGVFLSTSLKIQELKFPPQSPSLLWFLEQHHGPVKFRVHFWTHTWHSCTQSCLPSLPSPFPLDSHTDSPGILKLHLYTAVAVAKFKRLLNSVY